jgi:hypothetical protein
MPSYALTRRASLVGVLALAGGGALAACSSTSTATSSSAPGASAPGTAAASAAAVAAPAEDESHLVALYDAALGLSGWPADARAALAAIRDQHIAHRAALGGAPDAPAVAAPSSTAEALHALTHAERRAGIARLQACVAADDPNAARTLTFIAASETSHVPELRRMHA